MVDHALLPTPHDLAQCVHCGFCLPACPTYRLLGTEADSPRGRLVLMDALGDGTIAATAAVLSHLDSCLLCRACESACPSGVPFGKLLQQSRSEQRLSSARPLVERLTESLALTAVAWPRWVHDAAAALARSLCRRPFVASLARGSGRLAAAARLLRSADWTLVSLPVSTPPTTASVRARATTAATVPAMAKGDPAEASATGGDSPRVALLEGCVGRLLFGRVNAATVRLLSAAGCLVIVPRGQRCCGALHAHAGDLRGARRLARANIAAFERSGPWEAVVVNAAGCGSALAEYGELLADDPLWSERAARFAAAVRDALEILDERGLPPAAASAGAATPGAAPRQARCRVAYHDACHLAHARGVRDAPRRLLDRLPGVERVPLAEADRCCGSAGIYNLLHPATANALLQEKLIRLVASGADIATAANPGCLLHLAAGLEAAGASSDERGKPSGLTVLHPLQLLDQLCGQADPSAHDPSSGSAPQGSHEADPAEPNPGARSP